MGHQEENNLQPFRNTGTEEGKFNWNKCYHTKHCIFLWVSWLRIWYYSYSTHAYQFWKTALTGVYTANQQHISIQASQWLCKETQQHTQVNIGLFARGFEMVPLWAHRNVSTRTVKYQKALISSCFSFTQREALSRVSVLLWKFLTRCCLGLVQFIWCWNTFPFLKDKNISQEQCEEKARSPHFLILSPSSL